MLRKLIHTMHENMTKCIKPEVHNVPQCLQMRHEPWANATSTNNVAKFGLMVYEMCEQTDK